MTEFSELKNQVIIKIEKKDNEELLFHTKDKTIYKLYHQQDCCESVGIEEIVGNLDDLLNSPILMAEEVNNYENDYQAESYTWTFYKLATIKGYVTIRWLGTSNGYYSERVSFIKGSMGKVLIRTHNYLLVNKCGEEEYSIIEHNYLNRNKNEIFEDLNWVNKEYIIDQLFDHDDEEFRNECFGYFNS